MNENEKAVEKLKMIRKQYNRYEITHSIDLAIKALENEKPKGEWQLVDEGEYINYYTCSICGRGLISSADGLVESFPFCHCGADMRKGEEE